MKNLDNTITTLLNSAKDHQVIANDYAKIVLNPDKYWSAKSRKGVAANLSYEHQRAAQGDINSAVSEYIAENGDMTVEDLVTDLNIGWVEAAEALAQYTL